MAKSNKSLKVLLTACSGPGAEGIIHALRQHPRLNIYIIGGSVEDSESIGWILADDKVVIPYANDPQFIEKILDICEKKAVDLILPAFSDESMLLTQNLDRFTQKGVKILSPQYESTLLVHNKAMMLKRLEELGADYYPGYNKADTVMELKEACFRMGYPERKICVKPAKCNGGSRGFYILDEDYDRYRVFFQEKAQPVCSLDELLLKLKGLEEIPQMLIMEYIPGQEYGMDVLAQEGKMLACVARKRLPPQVAGIDMRIVVEERKELIQLAKKVVRDLNLSSILCMDVRFDEKDEKPYLIEVNPRQSAYTGISSQYANLLAMAIDIKLGVKVEKADYYSGYSQVVGIRYFGDFTICDGNTVFLGR